MKKGNGPRTRAEHYAKAVVRLPTTRKGSMPSDKNANAPETRFTLVVTPRQVDGVAMDEQRLRTIAAHASALADRGRTGQ